VSRTRRRLTVERGQTTVLLLGVLATLIAVSLVLAAFGQALGGRGRAQRVADIAAVSGAHAMRDAYPRLFEPPELRPGVPNPRHLGRAEYLATARAAALRAARSNGIAAHDTTIRFPDASSFAPTRIEVSTAHDTRVRVSQDGRRARIRARARAQAELSPPAGDGLDARGHGEYRGPLAHRQGKPMRPDVALAFDRMERAARAARHRLIVNSGFRGNAEQAVLFRRNPNPRWVAPPGRSLHRLGTELDLGPPSAYGWLARNASRFGFVKRYSWEPWHFGYTRSPGTASVGFGVRGGDGRATAAMQSFVPARYAPTIARAASRWGVSGQLLAAQIYAESNFNPFARSPAGAQGISQFMPGTARGLGLRNPFDPAASIDAQARLMKDLLRRFGSVPLALAAYNAGPGAVARCGCIPPYPETRGYVSRILGLLGGAGDLTAGAFTVRLVE
jgi:hypothetical protein